MDEVLQVTSRYQRSLAIAHPAAVSNLLCVQVAAWSAHVSVLYQSCQLLTHLALILAGEAGQS
jgi:hypothetical protein